MIRMILAHPRSRSHLLGSAFADYQSELFSRQHIMTTEFFQENKHMLANGTGYNDSFAKAYIEHLRRKYWDQSFTFKIHYCSVRGWIDALDLIDSWCPQEILACERRDKWAAICSLLIAERQGFTSFDHVKSDQPFKVTKSDFMTAYRWCVTDWIDGVTRYKSTHYFEYETIPQRLVDRYVFDPGTSRYKEQNSMEKLHLILNLNEVQEWWNHANDIAAQTSDHTSG